MLVEPFRHPGNEAPWEYSVLIEIHDERSEMVARRVVGVGDLRPGEGRKFTLRVEVFFREEGAQLIESYQTVLRRINRTNAATALGADGTLTDALARRDALRLRYQLLTNAADAAAGNNQGGYTRQLRSELKMLSALPVAELRSRADEVAKALRELDVRIQRANWEVDLLE